MRSRYSNLYLTILLIGLYFLLAVIHGYVLIDDSLYFNQFSSEYSYEEILDIISNDEQSELLSFVSIIIYYPLKYFLIALIIITGLILAEFKVNFASIFRIVVISDLIFVLEILIRITWFSVFNTDYSLTDLQSFYPLSVYSLFEIDPNDHVLVYVLAKFNLFELAYILLLSFLLYHEIEVSFKRSTVLVLSTYGSGLILTILTFSYLIILN
ncbi:hypothetical protein C900_01316 [Fulvivirga imtechensis AK7]|uniref:Yip1 domain-containing protein n=1 Tax=Fulvivirga imtechensis AK7 TaxID=1237149 RepID=L8JWF8_9BACT|nr:hypothetical protein C900_01316 [Fulvivirga imtechensis AK7]